MSNFSAPPGGYHLRVFALSPSISTHDFLIERMMTQLFSPNYLPFTFALGLMIGFLVLELVALLLGLSLHGSESDLDISPEILALQASFDLPSDATPDVPALLDASDALHGAELNAATPDTPTGLLEILGLRGVPLMIWLAALLFSFGVSGYVVQGIASAITGASLAALIAAPLAAAVALVFTRSFARIFARLVPRMETTATSAQFMGGLRGTVTQGTARAGSAAEVRLRDRHGNLHFMRCEPFHDADIIPEGAEVITVREKLGPSQWGLRILAIA
jgi:hypothetical protein